MKSKVKYFLGLLGTVLFISGCGVKETVPDREDPSLLAFSIRMPSDGDTRVGLSQKEDSKDLVSRWQEGDQVQLLARRGKGLHHLGTVNVTDISEDGKTAYFCADVRDFQDLEIPFILYCFTGNDHSPTADPIGGGNWAAVCPYDIKRGTMEGFKAPMYCEIKVDGNNPSGRFEHVGTYEVLHVANDTDRPMHFIHRGFDTEVPWYRGHANVWFTDDYDHTDFSGEWEGEAESDEGVVMPHAERSFISWYIPSGFPIKDARLVASVNGEVMRSSNTFSSSVTIERYHAYHMYVNWDGTELKLQSSVTAVRALEVLTPEIDFGEVAVGKRETKSLIIKNVGNVDAPVTIAFENHAPLMGAFQLRNASLQDDAVTRVIGPDTQQALSVMFQPDAAGEFNDTIVITSDALPGGRCVVPVHGTGKGEDTSFHLSASSIDVYVNTDGSVEIWNGSGEYEVVNENPDIVDQDINGIHIAHSPRRRADATTGEPIPFDRWWIMGKKLGNATLRLTDTQTGEELTLHVRVTSAPPLRLAADRIEIIAGETDKVKILSGCGWYEVTSDDPEIVSAYKATIGSGGGGRDDYTPVQSADYIVLETYLAGQTTVRVRDVSSNDVVTLAVTVSRNPYIPEVVDLGLPSGIKWALFNLGATKPEEFGDYYAWGEKEPKEIYDWESYGWCMGSDDTMLKYNADPAYGYEGYSDSKTVLDLQDDAAHWKLRSKWRMPTWTELDELRWNCTWEWVTVNGVTGKKGTGPNGNSIFLPAGGWLEGSDLALFGAWGEYWSSTLVTIPMYDMEDNPQNSSWFAIGITFSMTHEDQSFTPRYSGQFIRAVYDDTMETGGGGTVSGGDEF